MGHQLQRDNRISTDRTGWISLAGWEFPARLNDLPGTKASVQSFHLFEYAQRASFSERFPRLTCAAIAVGLLIAAVIAEIDCLLGLGYTWR